MEYNTPYELSDRSGEDRYRILADYIVQLKILDKQSGKTHLADPVDIVLNNNYMHFSKHDVLRIGFICGQLSRMDVES